MKTYECTNQACTLGTRSTPGRFTGGATAEQVHLLTGEPVDKLEKDKDYGEGFCPNCGEQGAEVDAAAEQKRALADAKAAYDRQVAEIKGES